MTVKISEKKARKVPWAQTLITERLCSNRIVVADENHVLDELTFLRHIHSLRWRHNDHDSVSIHQPRGCLLNRLFGCRSKKKSKLPVTGLCAGNSPGTGEFSAQMASNAENVSIWWRHHVFNHCVPGWGLLSQFLPFCHFSWVFFKGIGIRVIYGTPCSYLTGVTAAKRSWYLSNMNVIHLI